MYIDSHFHFDLFEKEDRVDQLVEDARAASVNQMIAIGGSLDANERAVRMAKTFPGTVFSTVGYDRDEAGNDWDDALLREQLALPEVVGVGETGLDYHYSADSADEQKALFGAMLERAAEFKKPVIIHSREADDDTLAMLREYQETWTAEPDRLAVLHCFTGEPAFAEALLELGLMISFSGIATFKNAASIRDAARLVPDDRILIETDAPYLAPVPHRGKPNQPAWVVRVAEVLAEERGVPLETFAQQTTSNAKRLFAI